MKHNSQKLCCLFGIFDLKMAVKVKIFEIYLDGNYKKELQWDSVEKSQAFSMRQP